MKYNLSKIQLKTLKVLENSIKNLKVKKASPPINLKQNKKEDA